MDEIANKIKEAIDQSQKVLMHCHPNPDPDSAGSALALGGVLESWGKQVTIIGGDSKVSKSLSGLAGYEKIVWKNWFELNLADYDLFIALDSSSVEQISKLGKVEFPENLKVVVIDHHASNKGYGQINWIEPESIATGEMLYKLFKKWGVELDHDVALNLLAAVYSDSGGFKYKNTTAQTWEMGTDLVKRAPDYTKALFILDNSNRKQKVYFQALALNSVKEYLGGRVAIAEVSFREMEERGIAKEDTAKSDIANRLISVEDWVIGIYMTEKEPEQVSVNMRTREPERYDLSKLALELGGGGHQAAGGALLSMGLDGARTRVLEAIGKVFADLKV